MTRRSKTWTPTRLIRRTARRLTGPAGVPEWRRVLSADRDAWDAARRAAADGPRVLIATAVGGLTALSMVESALAVALTLRGADVHILLCDRALPACLRAEYAEMPDPRVIANDKIADILCDGCYRAGERTFGSLGLRVHRFGELVGSAERERAARVAADAPDAGISDLRVDGCAVGEHAYAGALRYFATGDLESEPLGNAVLRRYLEGAILTSGVASTLLNREGFDAACFSHGLYSPHGIIGEICRSNGVRVVNWNVAYRKRCFIFSHDDTYHHTLLAEPTSEWDAMSWDDEKDAQIVAYLRSRWTGERDWVWFHERPDADFATAAARLGLDLAKPVVGLLSNVSWDAQLHYRANAFPDMRTWVLETIRYFADRPDLQLLIRIHPAEVRGAVPSRQPLAREIAEAIPELPTNVFVVGPEDDLSTYAASFACNAVIVYGTKTGVELASFGVPIIVAGEAWIRSKGLTRDATSRDQYRSILDALPFGAERDPEHIRRARMYAYHFFFRRMIPFSFMEPTEGWPPYRVAVSRLAQLGRGSDPGLDVVCDGILHATPFVYPAETLGVRGD